MTAKPLNIAIAGLGTVGAATFTLLQKSAGLIEARTGRQVRIVAVSARNKAFARGFDLSDIRWVDDATQLAELPEVDIVAELIGGSSGVAKTLVERALGKGKSVVTANKALIAEHGMALAELAEKHDAMLAFEAAVAAGIPIIQSLRDGLAANRFRQVAGILNGTCNYILTRMWNERCEFTDALSAAQAAGFAEANPAFDIEGTDTSHKLAILTTLAYGCPLSWRGMHVEGITRITLRDMEYAAELGYTVKLLGIAAQTPEGILQRVHPCLVSRHSTIARVEGAHNGILVEGEMSGRIVFEGQGAGAGPSASAVVGDIITLAHGTRYKPFILPASVLTPKPMASMVGLRTPYYLRLVVTDKTGVLAEITSIFADEGISMESFLQRTHQPSEPVQLVITTHPTLELAMARALAKMASLGSVLEPPQMIRIEAI